MYQDPDEYYLNDDIEHITGDFINPDIFKYSSYTFNNKKIIIHQLNHIFMVKIIINF